MKRKVVKLLSCISSKIRKSSSRGQRRDTPRYNAGYESSRDEKNRETYPE